MGLLFSEILDLTQSNYTQIEPSETTKSVGDWAERVVGTGTESTFVLSVWNGTSWEDKSVLTQ